MSLYNDDVWCVTIDKIRSTGSIQVSLLHIVMIVEPNASSTILLEKMSSAFTSNLEGLFGDIAPLMG